MWRKGRSRHVIRRIGDIDDPALEDYRDLTDVALRRRVEPSRGLYIAESRPVIARALGAGHEPRSFLCSEKWLPTLEPLVSGWPEVPVLVGSEDVLERVTGFLVHRGALAAMSRPDPLAVEDVIGGARRIAILENLVNHTNVGAVFRSAAAMGVEGVLISPRCADPLYRRSVRVSMGTVFQVPWTRLEPWPGGLDDLRDAGFVVAALALDHAAVPLDVFVARGLPERLALMLGAEGDGLSRGAMEGADVMVTIPMGSGVDSLNVAAASAVAFWATRGS
ncbi:MAG: RNA methyltransferase [Demequinaceae bacterium]|nr:RNA methyltransferase [Demequinaceae bacterium]